MQQYPKDELSNLDQVISIVQRIIELRQQDVSEFTELQRNGGYFSGFARATKSVAVNYTAGRTNLRIDVDATAGNRTVTLPAAPVDGEEHTVIKMDASANTVTISGNGKNINGSATLALGNTQYRARTVTYIGAAGEWRVTAGYL